MNEAESRAELIDPALKAAGWGVVEGSRIRRVYLISPGRIEGRGRRAKALKADYVLEFRNTKLGVVEAKAGTEEVTEGVGQAKDYAGKLAVRYAIATNGHGIYRIDMETGAEGEIPCFPTPHELWTFTFAKQDVWRDRFADVPFEDKGGSHPVRYYQDIAIERVLQAIAAKRNRILLTLATGTGKTFIAFQIAWKLFHSRWNLSGEPTRRPRILFLADRNILANQAYNAFSSFPEDALVRIKPEDIRKKGKDGKERNIQHMTCTSFWHPDGTPMSAQQFMELLFGKLPEFFHNEEELRAIWSAPDTRKRLLAGLAEKGFGHEQLTEMQRIINAEASDLFDVLAHVAYAIAPLTREVRAANARVYINTRFTAKQQAFLDFVLQHYVIVGVEELEQEKLTPLLKLKYHDSIADAVADLGQPAEIGKAFANFQKYLYVEGT